MYTHTKEKVYLIEITDRKLIDDIINKYSSNQEFILVLFEKQISNPAEYQDLIIRVIEKPVINKWRIELSKEITNLPHELYEYINFSNKTMQYLYTAKFKLFFNIQHKYFTYKYIQSLNLNKNNNYQIYSYHSFNINNTYKINKNNNSFVKALISKSLHILFMLIRLLRSIPIPVQKRNTLIHTNPFIRSSNLDYNNLQPVFINPHLEYLSYDNDQFSIFEDIGTNTKSYQQYIKHSKPRSNYRYLIEYYFIKSICSFSTIRIIYKDYRTIKADLEHIKESLKKDTNKILIGEILSFKSLPILYCLKYHAFKLFLKSESHIKNIVTIAENSSEVKPLLDAAKEQRVLRIGIQHGTIHSLHPHYLWHKKDEIHTPYPDVTILWGSYWKKFLINYGHMPAQNLITLGHMQSDIVYKLKQKKKENQVFTILFASQPLRNSIYRDNVWRDIKEAFSQLDNEFRILIRLHPREIGSDYIAKQLHQLTKLNIQYTLCHKINLYELFTYVDVIITSFSTVAIEALYFRIPVITIDYNESDRVGLLKNNVAINAKSEQELRHNIIRLYNGEPLINQKDVNNFIRKFTFKIDGKRIEAYKKYIKNLE